MIRSLYSSISTYWHPDEMEYTGDQLRPHFIYQHFQRVGNAMAAFVGPCRVELASMVDLEDVKEKRPIYSEKMLHFLIEIFQTDLPNMVLLQRLFICVLREMLYDHNIYSVKRCGDDLYENHLKLTVSIATISPVSGLIHTGINISSRNTPVPTKGLEDYQIQAKPFALQVMERFSEEMASAANASWKVRPVF